MTPFELQRANKLIQNITGKLRLDLSGLTVLTDVGTNYYSFLPLIALNANAEKVLVWCSDTSFGKAEQVIQDFLKVASELRFDYSLIEFAINERPSDQISAAQLVTNSFHLRPIDKTFIDQLARDAVIALMYEKWELRKADIDIEYCKSKKIKVAGTWENHPDLLIFNAVGNLAQKMIYEAGMEIWGNEIFVWSNDHFGETISKSLRSAGAASVTCSTDYSSFQSKLSSLDILFITDYHETKSYFGESNKSIFDIHEILAVNPNLTVVHLFGEIDTALCNRHKLNVYPPFNGKSQKMSFTLGHLGLKTIIDLQAAGLKVGELLYKNQTTSDLLQLL